jgi:uncharacterized membrane protein YeaQ/YmgE (transglycosylase-associated protein family)
MTFPAILFGVILSTAYGAAFHFWKGGNLKKMFLYIILAWLGFWVGHSVGNSLGWNMIAIGPLNIGMATIGSLIFLFVGNWLSRVEISRQ